MTELTIREFDEAVLESLKSRARDNGVSLEEEVRAILTDAVRPGLTSLRWDVDAIASRIRAKKPNQQTDSARLIREERDAWG